MEQFNANPIRSGVGLTVTPPQTASRSITPTESHKSDPQNLIPELTTRRIYGVTGFPIRESDDYGWWTSGCCGFFEPMTNADVRS